MARLETNEIFAGLPIDMEPIIGQGFEAGELYGQVDLGSRAAVEGVARYFRQSQQDAEVPMANVVSDILEANSKAPGTYVGFAGIDGYGDDIAYIYQRDETLA